MLRLCMTTLAVVLSFTSVTTSAEEIHISGSTSVTDVIKQLAENFEDTHPDAVISVQGVNSLASLTMLKKGMADIALSSHYLTQAEQESQLQVETLAIDSLVMIANMKNPVTNLSRREVFDIYRGNITNWKQLGGANLPIAVITREPTADSRYSFESLLGLTKIVNDHHTSTMKKDALIVNSSEMMKALVHHNPQAIGYISASDVDHSISAMTIDHIASTPSNIAKLDYPLAQPFLLMHYPQQDSTLVKAFLNYAHSADAHKILAQYGYQKAASAQ